MKKMMEERKMGRQMEKMEKKRKMTKKKQGETSKVPAMHKPTSHLQSDSSR
jgi:hypothetical protein